MAKYDALRDYLMRRKEREFEITFQEIEKVLGSTLPPSAARPQWWANVKRANTHVQRAAWGAAGYDAFLVVDSKKVKFRRVTTR